MMEIHSCTFMPTFIGDIRAIASEERVQVEDVFASGSSDNKQKNKPCIYVYIYRREREAERNNIVRYSLEKR